MDTQFEWIYWNSYGDATRRETLTGSTHWDLDSRPRKSEKLNNSIPGPIPSFINITKSREK